jgi:hypothetical protein
LLREIILKLPAGQKLHIPSYYLERFFAENRYNLLSEIGASGLQNWVWVSMHNTLLISHSVGLNGYSHILPSYGITHTTKAADGSCEV